MVNARRNDNRPSSLFMASVNSRLNKTGTKNGSITFQSEVRCMDTVGLRSPLRTYLFRPRQIGLYGDIPPVMRGNGNGSFRTRKANQCQ